MEAFRKYFSESQLKDLAESGPNWGVNVHTVGHHVHPVQRVYPDPEHPSTHVFQWAKGRRLEEFQMVYVAKGKGVYEGEGREAVAVEAGTLMLLFPEAWHRSTP